MTKRHEQELTEQEFEDFLEGRSGVARGYDRLRDVEPPPALDRAVLEQARAAVSGTARRPSFWSHWSSRLAAAAVVVLAIAVTLQLRPGPETIPVAMDEGAESGAAGPMPMEDAAPASPTGAGDAPIESRDSHARNAGQEDRGHVERGSVSSRQLSRSRSLEATVSALTPSDADMAALGEKELEYMRPSPANAEVGGGAYSSVDAASAARQRDLLAAYERYRRAEQSAEAQRTIELGKSMVAPPASRAGPPWREDPDNWLTLVDALLEAGREAEARSELAALVEAWPQHPIDPRYESWLPAPGTEEAAR